MPTSRSVLAALTSVAAVVAGGALLAPANANPSGTGLVISEAYLNGGSAGATYTNKYVELANPTGTAISLSGLSLQYRPATGTGNASTAVALVGTVPAHGFFVVQGATNGANGDPVPSPDQSAAGLNPAAGGGTLFVANGTAAINPGTGSVTTGVVDLLGWGTSNTFEGTAAPIGSVTTGPSRSVDEADTDVNSVDFKTQALTPGAGNGVTPPPIPTEHTIAEIQGTGATSPLVGQPVITQGVVTAAYPTGGFFGYVLQTDGTGTGDDATPGASDAIFVHQPSGAVNVTVGDELQVTGSVSEFQGLTEVNVDAADIHDLGAPPLGGVTARLMAYPTTTADREAHESELIAPTNQFTVTDNFDANTFGEIGLSTGDKQLWQPTDLFNPNLEPAQVAAVQADNAARGVVLNDGSSANYTSNASGTPLPWLRPDNPVRIGSSATLHQPVILDFRNGLWEFQPTHQVTDDGSAVATFGNTRTPNLTPADVGGDLKLGTFNVLNYFNTTGKDWIEAGHSCTFFNDRAGDPVTDNNCSDNGPRGAAESSGGTDLSDPKADVERQRAKEVEAINTMNADILSLEEIENSAALGIADRDDALKSLVEALNADAGFTRWAFAPSPSAADLPPLAQQDVIRTAFIYNPSKVSLVGASKVLADESGDGQPFANAREPLAQEFKRKGALDSDGFLVVVNHFKSKGDSNPAATGDNANGLQGAFNGDRVRQAHAVVEFAKATAAADGTKKIFLVGDFNSYTQEDPMQVLYQNGFVNQPSDDPRDTSYEFDGMAGSLDHVLANTQAANMISGRDVWQINAEESVGFEYSRYNNNAVLLYQANQFRASDHNPELVGLDAPFTQQASTVTVTATPDRIKKKTSTARVDVTVTGAQGITPTGTVRILVNGVQVATPTLSGGHASVVVGPFRDSGVQHVTVLYAGDDVTQGGHASVDITVTNGNP